MRFFAPDSASLGVHKENFWDIPVGGKGSNPGFEWGSPFLTGFWSPTRIRGQRGTRNMFGRVHLDAAQLFARVTFLAPGTPWGRNRGKTGAFFFQKIVTQFFEGDPGPRSGPNFYHSWVSPPGTSSKIPQPLAVTVRFWRPENRWQNGPPRVNASMRPVLAPVGRGPNPGPGSCRASKITYW